ncbi:MAG: aldolase [Anaerotruncus sp.]|nr:aldolase [Anaerotruncus sp.]
MTGYECKQAMAAGKTICGTLIVSPSPKWVKYIDKAGLDFVFIDTEHVGLDLYTLSAMCNLYAAKKLAPIVRIPSPDPYMASQVLDAGAHGVLAPYIETAEQVRTLVGAVHYKPIKGKVLEQALRGEISLPAEVQADLEKNNRNRLLFVNIESIPALENLDEILSVPGLDGIVIGPNDLSYSLGHPNDYDSEEFEQTVLQILRKTREKGIAAGVHYMGGIERQIAWAKATGMNMVFHSGDMYIFMEQLRQDLLSFREALGEDADSQGPMHIVI